MEIDDKQFEELNKAHALLKALYSDATVGVPFKRLVKQRFPGTIMPDLDAIDAAAAAGTTLEKRFDEFGKQISGKIDSFLEDRKKESENARVAAFEQEFSKVVKDRGYTKEGEEKLLGLMKERGIHSPTDAAIIFEATQPKPASKPRQFSTRMPFLSPDGEKDPQFEKLLADPEQFMMDEMSAALAGAGSEE